jgi:hypothetical protein
MRTDEIRKNRDFKALFTEIKRGKGIKEGFSVSYTNDKVKVRKFKQHPRYFKEDLY